MSSLVGNNIYFWITIMTNPVVKTISIVLTLLIALGIGFFLRRKLVQRLHKTVLDAWLVQTLGILMFVPPLILAGLIIPIIYIWDAATLWGWWIELQKLAFMQSLPETSWNLVQTLLLIALGMGVARTVRKVIINNLSENRIDINIRTLIGRVCFFIILLLVVLWILAVWHIPLEFPVAAVGIVTVIVSVSVQDILKDLMAGFYILVERPFFIGDVITTGSATSIYTGKVEDIQLRATKLRILSGEEVRVPNSLVFTAVVVNTSYYAERRAGISVTIPQEDFNKEETPDQVLEIVKRVEGVLAKPEPTAIFSSYANKQVTLTVHFWIATVQPSTVSDVMHELYTALPNVELTLKEFAGNV
jgi:small-conductance mechanosensitive channel